MKKGSPEATLFAKPVPNPHISFTAAADQITTQMSISPIFRLVTQANGCL